MRELYSLAGERELGARSAPSRRTHIYAPA